MAMSTHMSIGFYVQLQKFMQIIWWLKERDEKEYVYCPEMFRNVWAMFALMTIYKDGFFWQVLDGTKYSLSLHDRKPIKLFYQ